ncbi:MAG: hypothetical protein NTX44_13385 [Ignavibacteriales bacterium]|nr:hypothetical protein [Ignavibacteriales bacterium]
MEPKNLTMLSFLILAPYVVGVSPADSSFDEYACGIGGGQYATYDCSGHAHPNSIVDAGVKVTHKFETPFRIGLGASVISINGKAGVVPYPDLAFDFKYFSLGTTGIRVGAEGGPYGELAVLDQVPFFSGKGCFRIGVGMNTSEYTRLWLGVNTFPYNKSAFAGQFDFPITNNQFLFFNGRYGESSGIPEYGFSVGTRIRIK